MQKKFKILTRKSRLELKDEPLTFEDEEKQMMRSRFLQKAKEEETTTSLTWNDDFSSFEIDEFVSLLMKMESKQLRLKSMVQMNSVLKTTDISSFELRANSLIKKVCTLISQSFNTYSNEEKLESLCIIKNIIDLDKANLDDIPIDFLDISLNSIPLSIDICKSLFLELFEKYPNHNSLHVYDGKYLIKYIKDDLNFVQLIIENNREIIRFCPLNIILDIVHKSHNFSILIDATKYNEEARNNLEILNTSIDLVKKDTNKEIGVTILCNILNSKTNTYITHLQDDQNLIFALHKLLYNQSIGTIASITLSYIEGSVEVMEALQHWLQLERSVEVRILIRERISSLSE